jgi:Bardet-Biedl syndrome 5 protein
MSAPSVDPPPFWQDRELKFDATAAEFELRPGEVLIDTLDQVEDTKGNNGEVGMLQVTNLRLLWHKHHNADINLSVGFNCCTALSLNVADSKLRGGKIQALFVSCKTHARYEFTFTYLVPESPRLFTTVLAVWKAYDSSRLFRDLRLRTAIITEGELVRLPGENVFSRVPGVWNLSNEQGNLGTLFVTNVRVAWFASSSEAFNVSLPWVQITAIRSRESKFGPAFVLATSPSSGGYNLGFRVDPQPRMQQLLQELTSLWRLFGRTPQLGVEFRHEAAVPVQAARHAVKRVLDGQDVVVPVTSDAFAAYFADEGQHGVDRRPVLDPVLGLAVEKMRDGVSLEFLFSIGV